MAFEGLVKEMVKYWVEKSVRVIPSLEVDLKKRKNHIEAAEWGLLEKKQS